MKKTASYTCLFVFLAMTSFVTGCEEHPYKVTIDGKVPPAFRIKTLDSLYFVRILKYPAPESEIYPNEAGIWQIEVKKGFETNRYPEIKYGVVPEGFIQKIPQDGSAPPELKEGEEYLFFAPTSANMNGVRFKIENGKSVIIE